MRVIWRRLSRTELDSELVALGVLTLGGGCAAAWLMLRLPTPVCLFHAITGLPCLTCGGTRLIKCLLAGHMETAFGWNPLVFLAAGAAAIYMAYATVVIVLKLPRVRVRAFSLREIKFLRLSVILAIAANWIYLIWRFSHQG